MDRVTKYLSLQNLSLRRHFLATKTVVNERVYSHHVSCLEAEEDDTSRGQQTMDGMFDCCSELSMPHIRGPGALAAPAVYSLPALTIKNNDIHELGCESHLNFFPPIAALLGG